MVEVEVDVEVAVDVEVEDVGDVEVVEAMSGGCTNQQTRRERG